MPQIRKPMNPIKLYQRGFTSKPVLRHERPDLVKKHSRRSPVLNKNHFPKLNKLKPPKKSKA